MADERTSAGTDVLGSAARAAPDQPGVYLFLGDADDTLYVGKAKSLRSRLRQHASSGPPTSHLHERYELVRRVVWNVCDDEHDAAWLEADLIFALRPLFNADPGLRSRRPLGGIAQPPFLVVSEVRDAAVQLALDTSASGAGAVYGCFPHLGRGVSSALGIACSDGYVALLRLLWAAAGNGAHVPASITKSAPPSFEVTVDTVLRNGLHRLLAGISSKVLDTLADAASTRPTYMQPALARDRAMSQQFFLAGPRRTRSLRLRHGIKATPITADTYRQLLYDDITGVVGPVAAPAAGGSGPP